jgi:hypothetical protein
LLSDVLRDGVLLPRVFPANWLPDLLTVRRMPPFEFDGDLVRREEWTPEVMVWLM